MLSAARLATGAFAQQATVTATTASGQAVVLDLGGWQVTDSANQKVGKIEHMVVSPSGCIDAVVLNMEGNRLVPLPWQVVTVEKSTRLIGGAQPVFHVNVERAKLQSAPTVTKEQFVTISQNTQIYQHFNVQAPSGVGASGSATGSDRGTATTPDASKGTSPQGSTSPGSSTIQGSSTSPSTQPGSSTVPGSQGSLTNKPSGTDFQQPTQPSDTRPPQNRPPQNRPPENRPPSSTPSAPQ